MNMHAPTDDKRDMCIGSVPEVKYENTVRQFNAKLGSEGIFKPCRE
jgi:hypothetical protein